MKFSTNNFKIRIGFNPVTFLITAYILVYCGIELFTENAILKEIEDHKLREAIKQAFILEEYKMEQMEQMKHVSKMEIEVYRKQPNIISYNVNNVDHESQLLKEKNIKEIKQTSLLSHGILTGVFLVSLSGVVLYQLIK